MKRLNTSSRTRQIDDNRSIWAVSIRSPMDVETHGDLQKSTESLRFPARCTSPTEPPIMRICTQENTKDRRKRMSGGSATPTNYASFCSSIDIISSQFGCVFRVSETIMSAARIHNTRGRRNGVIPSSATPLGDPPNAVLTARTDVPISKKKSNDMY